MVLTATYADDLHCAGGCRGMCGGAAVNMHGGAEKEAVKLQNCRVLETCEDADRV